MKKILTVSIVSALLTVLPAKAQLQFGFKGGINVTEMSFDENVFKSSNRLGYFIGPTVKFALPVTGIGIDISGLYEKKTTKVNGKAIDQENIIVPANIRLNIGEVAGVYLAAGPQFAFNIGDDEFKWNKDGVENTFQLKKSYLSINLGAGIFFSKHFEVGFVYNIGVSNTGEASWSEARHAISDDTKAKGWSVLGALYF
jgi:hypothetical protein